jgi:hypothetical protein
MNKKICITSVQSIGCTFIDWSIHFLSGQNHYFNTKLNQYIELSQDPVTKINAHGHNKNYCSNINQLKSSIDIFESMDDNALCSVYSGPTRLDIAAKELDIPLLQITHENNLEKIINYTLDEYNKIFKICNDTNTKLIFVSIDSATSLYHQSVRSLDGSWIKTQPPTNEMELFNERQEIFFNSSVDKWNKQNLTNQWDIRERAALDIRPMHLPMLRNFDFQYPHLWINCQELWNSPINVIEKIFNYLELTIDPNRYDQWLKICHRWQQIQLRLLNFCYVHEHIIDAIINNWDYEIDLTFQQEIIIQHFLIYKHNLNLKTWQLEKFPNNTKDLHKLLEPNIHVVQRIYDNRSTT